MPIFADVFARSEDPVFFRATAGELYNLPFGAWTPWEEWVFLPAMLRYSKDYVYSEKERRKLAELCWFSEEVFEHDGVSVERMIEGCSCYSADLGNDEPWIVSLAERGADCVRRRELRRLVGLYRFCGNEIASVDPRFDRLVIEGELPRLLRNVA